MSEEQTKPFLERLEGEVLRALEALERAEDPHARAALATSLQTLHALWLGLLERLEAAQKQAAALTPVERPAPGPSSIFNRLKGGN
jgi:hypothetical protein